jgi:RNA polymerase sigma factor (sigma-70 family)
MTPVDRCAEFTTEDNEASVHTDTAVNTAKSQQRALPHERGLEYVTFALSREQQLRRRLLRVLGPHPDISDLLQEVYLQLLIAGGENSPMIRSLPAYAMTVARNKAIDWLRHGQMATASVPTTDIDIAEIASEGEQPDDLINADQELELFFAAVNALPSRCREVFLMRKVYGMSHKKICLILGISVNTAEQHISRATLLLGESLRQYGPRYTLLFHLRMRMTRFAVRAKARKLKGAHEPCRESQIDGLSAYTRIAPEKSLECGTL